MINDDPLFDAIGALPAVRPDTGHVDRVRDRCHAALSRPAASMPVVFEPAAVGTICAIYGWHVAKIVEKIGLP